MASQISGLMSLLKEDQWRNEVGFTPEVKKTLATVLNPASQDDSIVSELNKWLQVHQPCLFGRVAAKKGLISYCLLKESDLLGPDEAMERKIQKSRRAWKRWPSMALRADLLPFCFRNDLSMQYLIKPSRK